jgi:sugar fermentation stimulation protein A
MRWSPPLEKGLFLKRYKRFFADIDFDGEIVTAHVPNTGSLKTCLEPNSPCYFTRNDDPKRKLKFTLQMVKAGKNWVGVNTGLSNHLVWEAWERRAPSHWADFDFGQREVKINAQTRVDMVLWSKGSGPAEGQKLKPKDLEIPGLHFIEVKNTTYSAANGLAQFPDAVTTRGQKHLKELIELVEKGHSAEILFTVQRQRCETFSAAAHIDPEYARLLKEAKAAGVRVSAYPVVLSKSEIYLDSGNRLPWIP